ncbi:BppU family phage baseplate upper protein [Bacillus cereus group sp. BfR-BA-01119]|uniref:BppU family phage baseplate upper protein n=1 Tax=Bacillus cereus group sp. BfR-BA-01119 TaxID=3094878 RepID=UPI0029C4921E|nr:BppU family phage baseplate upper protein [Bacillus cereus group sp. BfR-BA-01119]MDX5865392.1 BppU family phage baseplate upper protein [Bacillus cereus group sp. BfR-BA-01119]
MKIKLVLDINKTQQAQLNAVVTGRQGDKETVTVNVFIVDSGVPYNLTGQDIYYEGLKPNNAYVRDKTGVKMINATQGNFEYTFRPETFGVAGVGRRSYFSIEQGGTVRASTQDFGIVTLADAMTGNTMSGPYISELEQLIQEAQWLVNDINSRWTSINTQLTQLQNKLNTMDVVKRSGDTMTGSLSMSNTKVIDFLTPTSKFTLGTSTSSTNPDRLYLYDNKNGKTVFDYSANDGGMFSLTGNTNLVKKSEIYSNWVTPDGRSTGINDSDLNTVISPGIYTGQRLVNAPEGLNNFFYIEVVPYTNTSYVMQRATILNNANQRIWLRTLQNNVWQPWIDVTGRGKDGRANLTLTADATTFDAGYPPIADRRGNTVTLRMAIQRVAGSSSRIVTTLPTDMRPIATIVLAVSSTDGTMGKVTITTTGEIWIESLTATSILGKNLYISTSYVVN